jgi:Tfp pilus assembly protein PilV
MSNRGGFSLFEVMISMAIFMAGLAMILQMLGTAELFSQRSSAGIAQQILCQNKLNRIALGLEPADEVRRLECPENPDFWYAVHSFKHPLLPLRQIEVTVWAKTPAEKNTELSSLANSQDPQQTRVFRLARLCPMSVEETLLDEMTNPQEGEALEVESSEREPGE